MNRFWPRFIRPLVAAARPGRILEVGADFGWNTRHLLAFRRETGCRLDIVDPAPRPELADVLAPFAGEYDHLPLKSLDAIPLLPTPDVALLDGDHNWHTVHGELVALFARAAETGARPPIVLFHDVAWPYARRDMYYDPEEIPADQRRPYAYVGLAPGEPGVVEDGMNAMLANALEEGGPRNGVLTALEDFVAEQAEAPDLHVLPFFNGLGILVPPARRTAELDAVITGFTSSASLLESVAEVERHHMLARVEVAKLEAALTRRTDALVRARVLLTERAERIAELEAALARRSDGEGNLLHREAGAGEEPALDRQPLAGHAGAHPGAVQEQVVE